MPTQVSFSLAGSHRTLFTLRMSTNPFSATGGPLPRLNIPLEARLTDRDIEVDILRFLFDLKLGNVFIGQGEIGPITHVSTSERYFTAVATCPREALPYLFNPQPSLGRLTPGTRPWRPGPLPAPTARGDERAYGLGEADAWHIESIGEKGAHHLEVQVARSDWFEQVVAQLGLGGYLVTPLGLPLAYRLGSRRSTTSIRRRGPSRRRTRPRCSATAGQHSMQCPAPSRTSSTPCPRVRSGMRSTT